MKAPLPAPVCRPVYSVAVRLGASVLTLAILAAGAGAFDTIVRQPPRAWLLPGAGVAAVAGSCSFPVRSVTTIDERGIRQFGLIEKRVERFEMRGARVAGFGVARRLLAQTESGRFRVFFGGTAELAQAFARIIAAYPPAAARAQPR